MDEIVQEYHAANPIGRLYGRYWRSGFALGMIALGVIGTVTQVLAWLPHW